MNTQWQPDQAALNQVLELFHIDTSNPTSDSQSQLYQVRHFDALQ